MSYILGVGEINVINTNNFNILTNGCTQICLVNSNDINNLNENYDILYIADSSNKRLLIYNLTTNNLLQTLNISSNFQGCLGVCFNKDNKIIYVTNRNTSGSQILLYNINISNYNLTIISGQTITINSSTGIGGIAYNNINKKILVGFDSNSQSSLVYSVDINGYLTLDVVNSSKLSTIYNMIYGVVYFSDNNSFYATLPQFTPTPTDYGNIIKIDEFFNITYISAFPYMVKNNTFLDGQLVDLTLIPELNTLVALGLVFNSTNQNNNKVYFLDLVLKKTYYSEFTVGNPFFGGLARAGIAFSKRDNAIYILTSLTNIGKYELVLI